MIIPAIFASLFLLLLISVIGLLADRSSLKDQVNSLGLLNKTLSSAAMEKEKRITGLKNKTSELEHQCKQLYADLTTSHKLTHDYLTQIDRLKTQLSGQISSHSAKLCSQQSQIGNLEYQKENLQKLVNELRQMSDERMVHVEKLGAEITLHIRDNATLKDSIKALEEHITLQKAHNKSLAGELHNLLSEKEAADRKILSLSADLKLSQKDLAKAIAAQDISEEKLHHLRKHLKNKLEKLFMPADTIESFLNDLDALVNSEMAPISLHDPQDALDNALGL